jgi:acetate---CoA ligase (ADP-forming)
VPRAGPRRGNQIDVEAWELIDELARNDATRAIVLYIEEFRDGRRFVGSVQAATDAGKPVVLLTVGESAAGARAARSHTGSLAGNLEVVDAACRVAGALRVVSPERAIDLVQILLGPARPGGRRLAIVTDGGGHAALASDLASARGLVVPLFSPAATTRLAEGLPPTASTGNPIDLAGGGEQDVYSYARVTRTALMSGEVDAVLLTGFFGGYSRRSDDYRRMEVDVAGQLAEACRESNRPLVVQTMHHDTAPADELRSRGIPVYASVDAAIGALALAARWSEPRRTLPALPPRARPVSRDDYWSARELMVAAGLPFPPARLVTSLVEAQKAGSELGFPLVVKALGLVHKTDAGGVELDVRDPDRLTTVVEDMIRRLAPSGLTIEGMVGLAGGVELIVGARWDRAFGPVVLVGLGGIYAETLRDTAIALAPIAEAETVDLLRSLRGAPLLFGTRGRPAMAIALAARFVSVLSHLSASHPEIAEMEVNPVLVTRDDAVGVDARITLAPPVY